MRAARAIPRPRARTLSRAGPETAAQPTGADTGQATFEPGPPPIAIIGATGRTGREIVTQALCLGHPVRALVRPGRRPEPANGLELIEGDLDDDRVLARALDGVAAALIAVAPRVPGDVALLERAPAAVVRAMRASSARRLIAVGCAVKAEAFVGSAQRSVGLGSALEAAVEASDLDWTLLMAPRLHDGPRCRRGRVSLAASPVRSGRMARGDLAALALDMVVDRKWVRRRAYARS